MESPFKKYAILIIVCITGCVPALLMPGAKDAERALASGNVMPLDTLKQAHKLYINKCGGCHFLYRPYQFTKDKWMEIMPEMKIEAKLSDEEYKMIYDYLMVMQENRPAN